MSIEIYCCSTRIILPDKEGLLDKSQCGRAQHGIRFVLNFGHNPFSYNHSTQLWKNSLDGSHRAFLSRFLPAIFVFNMVAPSLRRSAVRFDKAYVKCWLAFYGSEAPPCQARCQDRSLDRSFLVNQRLKWFFLSSLRAVFDPLLVADFHKVNDFFSSRPNFFRTARPFLCVI